MTVLQQLGSVGLSDILPYVLEIFMATFAILSLAAAALCGLHQARRPRAAFP